MRISRNIEAIVVVFLYLACLYLWTLPIQDNSMPYGEVDAASHYAVADYTYSRDRSVTSLPHYIDMRYGTDNRFKPGTLWYPPPFHTSLAIADFFGGGDVRSIYIANAVFCTLLLLGVYFLIRRFFGFEAALLSSFLLIFSARDIMVYLWGQWPERMGFAYLPVILYCFYAYCKSYKKKEEKPLYIYVMSLLLAINFFIHPMDFFHSLLALVVIGVFFFLREKRIFFSFKHLSLAVVLFLLAISIFPYQSMNVFVRLQEDKASNKDAGSIGRLFSWFKEPTENPGVPSDYFFYRPMIGPYWTIPFLLFGLIFLILRRNRKDLVMLGWLLSLYVMIHLDVIGKGRVHRSLSGTAHIFYPLMVLGLLYLISLVPVGKNYKKFLKYAFVFCFAFILFFSFGTNSVDLLKDAYGGLGRVNQYQYDLAQWLRGSEVSEDSDIFHMGAVSLAKTRWIYMVGQRYMASSTVQSIDEFNISYVVMDYSDWALMGNVDSIAKLDEWEKSNLANNTLVYTNEYIRVYEFGT